MQLSDASLVLSPLLAAIDSWPSRAELVRLALLAFDLVAIVSVVAGRGGALRKAGWTVAVLLLPVLGMILYFTCGRDARDV